MKTLMILMAIAIAAHLYLRKNSSPTPAGVAPARPRRPRSQPRPKPGAARRPVAKVPSDYGASSIYCGSGACEKAQSIKGVRLLREKVPSLPLAACDASRCECRYRHHEDRREDLGDRRAPSGLVTELYAADSSSERRDNKKSRGRRAQDWVE